jgi:hypothetical protein
MQAVVDARTRLCMHGVLERKHDASMHGPYSLAIASACDALISANVT